MDPANLPRIPFGLKTPPYTYSSQFKELISALVRTTEGVGGTVSDVSFITATNTLGSCVVFGQAGVEPGLTSSSVASFETVLPGSGIGGLAGAPLHPLALGNVMTLKKLMDEQRDRLGHIQIVGIGGVLDAGGFRRMKTAGATVVGVGTGLGLKGVEVFKEIETQLGGSW
jgi:dihydroorotate dehydrogenase (fumarate)